MVPIAQSASQAPTPSALTNAAQPRLTPSRKTRQVKSSSHGTQHSAAVQAPGTMHATSAVETVGPAVSVAGQLNPWHGYSGCSVAHDRSVALAGHDTWHAAYAVTMTKFTSWASAQVSSQDAIPSAG